MSNSTRQAVIKQLEPENQNLWLVDKSTDEILCEVFTKTEDESKEDMQNAGYREISPGFWIEESQGVPVEIEVNS